MNNNYAVEKYIYSILFYSILLIWLGLIVLWRCNITEVSSEMMSSYSLQFDRKKIKTKNVLITVVNTAQKKLSNQKINSPRLGNIGLMSSGG